MVLYIYDGICVHIRLGLFAVVPVVVRNIARIEDVVFDGERVFGKGFEVVGSDEPFAVAMFFAWHLLVYAPLVVIGWKIYRV